MGTSINRVYNRGFAIGSMYIVSIGFHLKVDSKPSKGQYQKKKFLSPIPPKNERFFFLNFKKWSNQNSFLKATLENEKKNR